MSGWTVTDARIFFGIAGAVVAYVIYMMFRRQKSERPGSDHREPEL